jgi:hypothetical protein
LESLGFFQTGLFRQNGANGPLGWFGQDADFVFDPPKNAGGVGSARSLPVDGQGARQGTPSEAAVSE